VIVAASIVIKLSFQQHKEKKKKLYGDLYHDNN